MFTILAKTPEGFRISRGTAGYNEGFIISFALACQLITDKRITNPQMVTGPSIRMARAS